MKHAPDVAAIRLDAGLAVTMSSDAYAEHMVLKAPVDLGDCGDGLRLDELTVLAPGRIRVPVTVLSLDQIEVRSANVEWTLGEELMATLADRPAPMCAAWSADASELAFMIVATRDEDRRCLREIHGAARHGLAFATTDAFPGTDRFWDGLAIVMREA